MREKRMKTGPLAASLATRLVPLGDGGGTRVASDAANDVAALAETHAADVAAVLKFLKEASVVHDTVQTSNMSLGDNKEHRNGDWVNDGYVATTKVSFQVTDLSQYRALWIGLTKLKGVSIDRVNYLSSKRIQVRAETRLKALQAARDKANSMAAALGARAAEPMAIDENSSTVMWMENGNNRASIDGEENPDASSSVALGRIPITVSVNVTFRLVNEAK